MLRISCWSSSIWVMGWCLGWFALWGQSALAGVVISSFEEGSLATNLSADSAFEGLPGAASQFRSGAVTFQNDGVFFGGSSWSGFGYSRRAVPGVGQQMYNNSNDLIARPGSGEGGSATWAVVGGGGIMTADAGYRFGSLSLTSTLYSWNSMTLGDPFAGPALGNGRGTGRFDGQDDFFTVRFTNTANAQFMDFHLADFRGATDYVVGAWQTFDLSLLSASQLSLSFLGSRETNYTPPPDPPEYFLDTPSYVALDNISVVSVPEPGSLLLATAGSLCALRIRLRLTVKR
ncbi:MAG: DUF4465 domain-containing protein [Pirellulaceae bacterium]|nr:DUF4465 domain-containing protein [Pirellulaceae bacterium]